MSAIEASPEADADLDKVWIFVKSSNGLRSLQNAGVKLSLKHLNRLNFQGISHPNLQCMECLGVMKLRIGLLLNDKPDTNLEKLSSIFWFKATRSRKILFLSNQTCDCQSWKNQTGKITLVHCKSECKGTLCFTWFHRSGCGWPEISVHTLLGLFHRFLNQSKMWQLRYTMTKFCVQTKETKMANKKTSCSCCGV